MLQKITMLAFTITGLIVHKTVVEIVVVPVVQQDRSNIFLLTIIVKWQKPEYVLPGAHSV